MANFESGKEEDVKKDAELMKPPANVPAAAAVAAKTPEKNITKTAEDEIKAKAAKNIATKRAPPAKAENGTNEPNLKAGKTEVNMLLHCSIYIEMCLTQQTKAYCENIIIFQ